MKTYFLWSITILLTMFSLQTLNSCGEETSKLEIPDQTNDEEDKGDEDSDYEEKDYTVKVNSKNRKQKITQWGHDIKQLGKAESLTPEACKEIFEDGKFNLLRIPIYANAHKRDGSLKEDYYVRMTKGLSLGEEAIQWELVSTEGEWFHLRNVKFDKYIRAFPPGSGQIEPPNTLELDIKSYTGNWTQWRLIEAGEGYFHIESRAHERFLRGNDKKDLALVEKESTGNWTQWKLVDAGNGLYYIEKRGSDQYLYGGGSAYALVMAAISNAVNNGNPALFASHKIFDNNDQGTTHNANFGYFYTDEGVDVSGYAQCIDYFLEFIENETGQAVKYLGPRCELGRHWTPESFVEVVNQIGYSNRPLIVSPEAAYAINSDKFWTKDVESVTDIKTTHNKEKSPLWPDGSKYDWDAETVGGNQENFILLFFKLHEAFYKGGVTGIVFWGDVHLSQTNDDANNGPFRRELVDASEYHLVEVEKSFSPTKSVIAFETEDENAIKVFYSTTERIEFKFDRSIKKSSVPFGATYVTDSAFEMPETGDRDYGSFRILFNE